MRDSCPVAPYPGTDPEMSVSNGQLEQWIGPKETAVMMRVSVATVLRTARRGELPYRKVGRQYRFVPSEVRAATQATSPRPVRVPGRVPDWKVELAGLDPYRPA